jgi:hypothetical protein
MKKLKLDLDSLDVRSFATETVPEERGTVQARGITLPKQELTFPQTDTQPPSLTYPDTWGTGPCTTAPSSDFPCYTIDEQTVN